MDETLKAPLERIAKVLTGIFLNALKDLGQIEKIARLKQCGFENTEIAEMLGTTTNTVNVAVHSIKRRKQRRGRHSAKAPR